MASWHFNPKNTVQSQNKRPRKSKTKRHFFGKSQFLYASNIYYIDITIIHHPSSIIHHAPPKAAEIEVLFEYRELLYGKPVF